MSADHVYVLRCDAPDCQVRFTRDLLRADQTRQIARDSGWVHGLVQRPHGPARSIDYCAEHASLGVDLVIKPLLPHAREVGA